MEAVSPALSIDFRQRKACWKGRNLELSPQYFELYAHLAARRVEEPERRGGYVEREELLALPSWSRNSLDSLGKQMSRHMGETRARGLDLIEAVKRTTGPYRLKLEPEEVQLDLPPVQILAELAAADPHTSLARHEDETAFLFSKSYWQGVFSFDGGQLKKAHRAFEKAMQEAPTPQWRAAASFYVRRILERWGDWDEAEEVRRRSEADIRRCGRYESWARARDLTLAAWLAHRQRQAEKAKELYQRALSIAQRQGFFQILGDIHNGLGEILRESKEYRAALDHYKKALDVWLLSEYFFGFQAVYFNIGAVYVQWGDDLTANKETVLARRKYERALEWTQRCTDLCETLGIGYDMAEDYIQLSNIYLRLRRLDLALDRAKRAQQMALASGNLHSVAGATRMLVEAHLAKKQPEQAEEAVAAAERSLGGRLVKALRHWLQ